VTTHTAPETAAAAADHTHGDGSGRGGSAVPGAVGGVPAGGGRGRRAGQPGTGRIDLYEV